MPAKASATNTKQFNGAYGCTYCFHEGERFNRARIYPPLQTPCQVNTTDLMVSLAAKAEETGEPQLSILSEHIELPACIPIDYMHSILEGVFKSLMKYWFDSKYHKEPYSLRKHTHSINKIVSKVKPPTEIPRLPRSLAVISFFKASEYRAWLLFYGLPILSRFLPPEHTHHLSLLVTAVHILLSDEIKQEGLEEAIQLLACFHDVAGDLYTNSFYTANMHSLMHIGDREAMGAIVGVFNVNMNGYLGGTYHGTKRIVLQMSFQLQLQQSLPDKLEKLIENEPLAIQDRIKCLIEK